MISAGDFRNGKTLEIEGTVYQILEFQHVKPGKGAAFVRTKLKDIKNGGVIERSSGIRTGTETGSTGSGSSCSSTGSSSGIGSSSGSEGSSSGGRNYRRSSNAR